MLSALSFRRSRAVVDSFDFKLETIEVLTLAFLGICNECTILHARPL